MSSYSDNEMIDCPYDICIDWGKSYSNIRSYSYQFSSIRLTLDSYLPNPNANPILGTLSLGLLNFNNEPNKMNVEIDVNTELSI